MVLSTEWSQVEVIDLINDGNGLGFILVGGRSTGVVIKALTPGGVAERDQRLQLGDHLLQIGDVNLRGFSSEQVATVLRQTGAQVRLIVARPVEPTAIDYHTLASHAPIIPTKLLSDPEELSRHLFQNPSLATATTPLDVGSLVGLVTGAPAGDTADQGNVSLPLSLPLPLPMPLTLPLPLALPQTMPLAALDPAPDTELADLPLPPIPANLASSSSSCLQDLDIVPYSILSPPPTTALLTARQSLQLPLGQRWQNQEEEDDVDDVDDDDDDQDEQVGERKQHVIAGKKLANDGDCCSVDSESPSTYVDSPETETYVVELHKNVYGLGITVAGYVCEEEDLSGIFVKSIIEGSAAEMSRQIQINDRIVAVDGRTLAGVTNHQAVELLRNTDIEVHLTLERFLRGRKFEHLQVALTEMKVGGSSANANDGDAQSQLSMPASPSIATLSWLPPKSADADSIVTDAGDGHLLPDFPELPSRDTVDSNMSHMLDRSDHSAPPLTNGNGNGMGHGLGHGHGHDHDSGNDTDEQCPEPEPEPEPEPQPKPELKPQPKSKSETESIAAAAAAVAEPEHGKTPTNEPDVPAFKCADTATPVKLASPSAGSLRVAWKSEFPESEILVAEINKLSGLGISLEGTVDVECGIEKRPHHYIRSILEDGPVGKQGILRPGDELLQVNEHKLQGLRHIDVVKILKELPASVKLVCARGTRAPSIINTSQNAEAFETRSLLPGGHQSLQNLLSKAQSESSLYTSSTATLTESAAAAGAATAAAGATVQRSKSLDNMSGLALWSSEVTVVHIEKSEQGFGFSILDYQDPLDAEGSVIVIRGLIRGGAAEATNEIYPGDRLISVGEHSLQGLELDEAVAILKAMPPGRTRLGICRPLSTSDSNSNSNIASPLADSASST
ncbi:patj homolog [Drosophila hydei]|uniref:Patj homolog n=1 Tax=Drosophila hydei TaxID=7224 RepID=A0A6J1L851_DROHY|nr:patj homolog [Drosophila hydei]